MKTVIIAVTAVSRSSINCSLCTNGGGKGFFFWFFVITIMLVNVLILCVLCFGKCLFIIIFIFI